MMHHLAIDIETYSSADLSKCGVYKYTEAPDFTILMAAYSCNGDEVQIIDFTDPADAPKIEQLKNSLTHPDVFCTAYNAAFERACLAKYFGIECPPQRWECTMAKASIHGLPLGLDACAKALGLDQQKDAAGKALIKYFSIPCKPTRANGMRTRNLPQHDLFRWTEFKEYCMQDVRTEQAIREKLAGEFPEDERKIWMLDQQINDIGILMDPVLITQAIRISNEATEKLLQEAKELTGIDNPKSTAQMRSWINDNHDDDVDTLTKEDVKTLIKSATDTNTIRVLEIRQEISKSSVKKYEAMQNAICADNRVRGLLQYHGSSTGRWAGRLIQPQNMTKNEWKDIDIARELVKAGNAEDLDLYFGISTALSQLVRTAFIAKPGHRFIVADFSAIEARVIAWLAGEKWRLDVFATHGKIYEASASQMFKVPIEQIGKGSPLRQKGKIAELALGYQGAVGALEKMGANKMGISSEELPKLVAMWRSANKAIAKFWTDTEEKAIEAIENPGSTITRKSPVPLSFRFADKNLYVTLPSGRDLTYIDAQIKPNRFQNLSITYMGMDQTTKQWSRQETYGGKLVENIVQAVARDILAYSMLRLAEFGYSIVLHVHDEVVIEAADGFGSVDHVVELMSKPFPWSAGLPMTADGYETKYYKKD